MKRKVLEEFEASRRETARRFCLSGKERQMAMRQMAEEIFKTRQALVAPQ